MNPSTAPLDPPNPATAFHLNPTIIRREPGSWSINYKGRSWHEAELTAQHLAWLCLLDGNDTWAHLDLSDLSDLNPIHGPVRLMSLIVCCVAIADEVADADLLAIIVGTDDESDDKAAELAHEAMLALAQLFNDVRSLSVPELMDCFTIH